MFSPEERIVPVGRLYFGMGEEEFRLLLPGVLPEEPVANGAILEKTELFGVQGTCSYTFVQNKLRSVDFSAEAEASYTADDPLSLEKVELNYRLFEHAAYDAVNWLKLKLGRPSFLQEGAEDILYERWNAGAKAGEHYLRAEWENPETKNCSVAFSMLGRVPGEAEQLREGRDFLPRTYRLRVHLFPLSKIKLEVNGLYPGANLEEAVIRRGDLFEAGMATFGPVEWTEQGEDGERQWLFEWEAGKLVGCKTEKRLSKVVRNEADLEAFRAGLQELEQEAQALQERMESTNGRAGWMFRKSETLRLEDVTVDSENDRDDQQLWLQWKINPHTQINVYVYAWARSWESSGQTEYFAYGGLTMKKA